MRTASSNRWASVCLACSAVLAACGDAPVEDGDNGLCMINCAGAGGMSGSTGGGSGGSAGMAGFGGGGGGGAGGAGGMIVATGGNGGGGGSAGATSGGEGGAPSGGMGSDGGMVAGGGGSGGSVSSGDACTPAPMGAVSDFGARGPFDVTQEAGTGPSGQYTMFRPATLGEGGFLHPPVSWGNGVTTTPSFYVELLETVASHGFVVIASDSATMTAELVRDGLSWLIEQNDAGEFAGKLKVDCAATIGYSMGGGSAVGAADHPNVKAVVSMHGLNAAAESANGPILLITSDNDGFVTKSMFVAPTYQRSSTQPTIMATLETGLPADFGGHLIPLGDAGDERAPLIAWLRYWIYGDTSAEPWFFGSDCTLCKAPWTDIQKKNHTWD